jgi:hypothetical protein
MDYSTIRDMLHKDAITAGYGVVTATIRKGAAKVLGDRGVGAMGMNALSIAVGMGLSQVENPHVKIVGSALRIRGIASVGNSIVERIVNRNKTTEEK